MNADVGVDGGAQQVAGIGVGGERRGDRGEEVGGEALGDGADEAVAVAEVAVEDRLGDPAGLGELLHGGAGPDLADGPDGGVEELLAALGAPVIAFRSPRRRSLVTRGTVPLLALLTHSPRSAELGRKGARAGWPGSAARRSSRPQRRWIGALGGPEHERVEDDADHQDHEHVGDQGRRSR